MPDLRNTRVIDIVEELQDFGVEVQIHDPYASHEEAEHEYGVSLIQQQDIKPADAVILAVPHRAYLEQGWGGIKEFLKPDADIIVDVKARLDRDDCPENLKLWRL